MKYRFVYAWTIFIIVFAYVNAVISAKYAYSYNTAGVWDYFIGLWIAILVLFIGLAVGQATTKNISEENRAIHRNIIALILATILEIGFNTWNVFMHI